MVNYLENGELYVKYVRLKRKTEVSTAQGKLTVESESPGFRWCLLNLYK